MVRFQVSQIGDEPDAKGYLKHFDKLVQWAGLAKVLHVTSGRFDQHFSLSSNGYANMVEYRTTGCQAQKVPQ